MSSNPYEMHGRPILRNSRGLPLYPTELFMASELSVPSPPKTPKSVLQQLTSFLFLSRLCLFFSLVPQTRPYYVTTRGRRKQKRRKRKFQKNVREQTMNLARHRCAFSSCVNSSSFLKICCCCCCCFGASSSLGKKKDARSPGAVRASTSI